MERFRERKDFKKARQKTKEEKQKEFVIEKIKKARKKIKLEI